ncbi:MAG: hypothetical protein IJ262_10870 [Clostridia bacterium]|nr:hypothetical protein [Clostridia bacterium]
MKYSEKEILGLIERYNSMNRKNITINLSTVYKTHGFKNKDIIRDFGYTPYKVNSWSALSSPNVPTFEDAIRLAVKYSFSIEELLK